jgi:hypothetical protein
MGLRHGNYLLPRNLIMTLRFRVFLLPRSLTREWYPFAFKTTTLDWVTLLFHLVVFMKVEVGLWVLLWHIMGCNISKSLVVQAGKRQELSA